MATKKQEPKPKDESTPAVQYVAVARIMRNPVIEPGTLVPVGDGPGDIAPGDIGAYLNARVIRKRKENTPVIEPAVVEEPADETSEGE